MSARATTGNARCDKLTAQIARADQNGYRLRCDAPFAGQANTGRLVLGWTDHATDTIWIWPERLVDSRALRKVAWHEVGHVVWERRNRSGTQAEEERWAMDIAMAWIRGERPLWARDVMVGCGFEP